MSISPPSDIVLDVVTAVNPAKYAVALQRLQKLAGASQTDPASFSKALKTHEPVRAEPARPFYAAEKTVSDHNNDLLAAVRKTEKGIGDAQLKKAHQKLEAVFLQGIIKSMLSGQEGTMYGKGIAGDYWKSFMAEAIAEQVSKGKGIGIADSLNNQQQSPAIPRDKAALAVHSSGDYRHFFQKLFMEELSSSKSS